MLPVILYKERTVYTIFAETRIIKGKFTQAKEGILYFSDARVYDLKTRQVTSLDSLSIFYSEVIFFSESMSPAFCNRSEFCWELMNY